MVLHRRFPLEQALGRSSELRTRRFHAFGLQLAMQRSPEEHATIAIHPLAVASAVVWQQQTSAFMSQAVSSRGCCARVKAAHRKDLQHTVEVIHGAADGRADVDVDNGRPRAVGRQPIAQLVIVNLAARQRPDLQRQTRGSLSGSSSNLSESLPGLHTKSVGDTNQVDQVRCNNNVSVTQQDPLSTKWASPTSAQARILRSVD
jgi:hypothetical protein